MDRFQGIGISFGRVEPEYIQDLPPQRSSFYCIDFIIALVSKIISCVSSIFCSCCPSQGPDDGLLERDLFEHPPRRNNSIASPYRSEEKFGPSQQSNFSPAYQPEPDLFRPVRRVAPVAPVMHPLAPKVDHFVRKSTLFKYVPNKERSIEMITQALQKPNVEEKLTTLLTTLETFPLNMEAAIFKDPDIFHLIVLLHIEGKITDTQVGTLFTRLHTISRYRSETARGVLPNKNLPAYREMNYSPHDPDMIKMLVATFIPTLFPEKGPFLDAVQTAAFLEKLENLPPSERQFLVGQICHTGFETLKNKNHLYTYYDKVTGYTSLWNPQRPDILDATYIQGGINIFNRVDIDDTTMRMYPSIGMVNLIVEALGKAVGIEEIVPPTICFGAGPTAWEGTSRIISVPSPYADLPTHPDTFFSTPDIFPAHDFYHLYVTALISEIHRKIFFKYAEALKNSSVYQANQELIDVFIDKLLDMDTYRYREVIFKLRKPDCKNTPQVERALAFWFFLEDLFKRAITTRIERRILAHDKANQHLPLWERERLAQGFDHEGSKLEKDYTLDPDLANLTKANIEAIASIFLNQDNSELTSDIFSTDALILLGQHVEKEAAQHREKGTRPPNFRYQLSIMAEAITALKQKHEKLLEEAEQSLAAIRKEMAAMAELPIPAFRTELEAKKDL